MQKSDGIAAGSVLGVVALFAFVPGVMDGFIAVTKAYPFLMSAFKFAVLATFGECLGLRVAAGCWNKPGFGIIPKAFVWAFLGIGIRAAFAIFAGGAPVLLRDMGLSVAPDVLKVGELIDKLPVVVAISVTINLIFAPMFMTLHKVTDMHIAATGGTLKGFFSPINVAEILSRVDWKALWGFVFKKTIPFFWIPAHIITFLIPPHFQVLYAAALGVILGLILATSGRKKVRAA